MPVFNDGDLDYIAKLNDLLAGLLPYTGMSVSNAGNGVFAAATTLATAYAGFEGTGDTTAKGSLRVYGTASVATGWGQTLANWAVIAAEGAAAAGLILGTVTNKPIIVGVNNVEVVRFDPAGVVHIKAQGGVGAALNGYYSTSGAAVAAGVTLFGVNGIGWDGASNATGAQVAFKSAEAWTPTARGSRLVFSTTKKTTQTLAEVASFEDDGTFLYAGTPELTRENYVINGDFEIAQRGTNFALTTAPVYTVDRWAVQQDTAANGFAQQQTNGAGYGNGTKSRFRIGRNAGAVATGFIRAIQVFESARSIKLAGKKVCISWEAQAGANYSGGGQLLVTLATGTGVDGTAAQFVGGSWTGWAVQLALSPQPVSGVVTKGFVTLTLPAGIAQVGIQFSYQPSGTAGADDSLYLYKVRLREGSVPTGDGYRLAGAEWAECRRFCRALALGAIQWRTATKYAGNIIDAAIEFDKPMRAAPTLKNSNLTAWAAATPGAGQIAASSTATAAFVTITGTPSCSLAASASNGVLFRVQSTGTFSGADAVPVFLTMDPNSTAVLDAEL